MADIRAVLYSKCLTSMTKMIKALRAIDLSSLGVFLDCYQARSHVAEQGLKVHFLPPYIFDNKGDYIGFRACKHISTFFVEIFDRVFPEGGLLPQVYQSNSKGHAVVRFFNRKTESMSPFFIDPTYPQIVAMGSAPAEDANFFFGNMAEYSKLILSKTLDFIDLRAVLLRERIILKASCSQAAFQCLVAQGVRVSEDGSLYKECTLGFEIKMPCTQGYKSFLVAIKNSIDQYEELRLTV